MIRPQQALPEKEKDKSWKDGNLRYWNFRANLQLSQTQQLKLLYQLASGVLQEVDYTFVTNPINSTKWNDYPAKIRNYDIISPVFMQLMGEFISRPIDPIVICKNSDIESVRQQKELTELIQSLETIFVNQMIKLGRFIPNQGEEEPQHPEIIKRKINSIKDFKTILGQNVLDYVRDHQRLDTQDRKLFYHFMVSNLCVSYKTIRSGDVIREICHPLNFYYFSSGHVDFIEDCEAVKYVSWMSLNEVVDTFRNIPGFSKEILDDLEARPSVNSISLGDTTGNESGYFNALIPVIHIQWTSLCKIIERVSYDELGSPTVEQMSEDYVPEEDEQVNVSWVNEQREGWIVNGKHYLGGDPIPIQRGSLTNPNQSKKSYNGRIFMADSMKVMPLASKLYPYQVSYNIVKYQIEKTLNKNKDKIAVIPLGLINSGKEGFDTDKTMYYMDAMSALFVDESADNAQIALNSLKSIDLSLGNYVQWLYNYSTQIKEEAYELVGFNRFRRSDTKASDAVYNVQQGQYTSSLLTEEWFKEFEEFREREYQGILDLSKFAYAYGKKANFIRNDSEVVYLSINPEDIAELEFGIVVKNGGEARRNLDLLKAQATQFAQNQVKPSVVGKIITQGSNPAKLIEELQKMEDDFAQQQQQAQQQEMQVRQEEMQLEQERFDAELEFKYWEAQVKSLSSFTGEEKPTFELEKLLLDREKSIRDNATKRYVADKQEKIAKVNKN